MCGIAGFVRAGGGADLATIKSMTDAVAHRGPNGSGHYVEGGLALGHRRLSVLDLSEHGHQPMDYADGALVLVFNGEIYNYIELRAELRGLGHRFRSETDSEVILAAYCQWGEDCVSRFNGMWAFVIFDKARNLLFVSRDRFGIKPFYYVDAGGTFAFGSEIRQLLPFFNKRTANIDALKIFLLTNGSDMGETTFFENVRRLPGGHSGIYDLGTNAFRLWRYYDISLSAAVAALPLEEAVGRLGNLLQDAVRLRLRSDVRVGTCLSGGLDSSTVATLAARLYGDSAAGNFSAITAVSEQASNNEAHFAEMVVKASDLDWLPVRPSYQDFTDTLANVVTTQEEPFSSTSLTMQYLVMKTARDNGVTVLLDGQGGDETLLGYEKYYAAYVASTFKQSGPAAAIAAIRSFSANNSAVGPLNMAKYLVGGISGRARYAYYKLKHRHIANAPAAPPHLLAFSSYRSDVFNLQKMEISNTNLPVLLRYEDKNSMAHGIEARLPFLDYRLVELNLSLPNGYKIHDGWTKWILRKAMEGSMPDAVVWRRNKFGFEAPEVLWLKAHYAEMAQAIKSSPLIGELADVRRLSAVLPRLDRRSLWRLYSVALWEKAFQVTA